MQTNTLTDEPSGTAQILNSLTLQGGRATVNAFAVKFLKIIFLQWAGQLSRYSD